MTFRAEREKVITATKTILVKAIFLLILKNKKMVFVVANVS